MIEADPLQKSPFFKTPLFIGIILGIFFTLTLSYAYYSSHPIPIDTSINTPYPPTNTTIPANSPSVTNPPTATPTGFPKKEFGSVTFFDFPKPIANLDIFVQQDGREQYYDIPNAKFHQIGTFEDGSKLINLYLDWEGMGGGTHLFRLVQSGQKVYAIDVDTYKMDVFNPDKVSFVSATIKGLEVPETIDTQILTLRQNNYPFSNDFYSFTEFNDLKTFRDSQYGFIYYKYQPIENTVGISQKKFYLRLKDDTIYSYDLDIDFLPDDFTPQITWSGGQSNQDQFQNGLSGGCGGISYGLVIGQDQLGSKQESGLLSDGSKVYKITDSNNPVVQRIYNDIMSYKSEEDKVDIQDFIEFNSHFLWQDPMGDWQLFVNQKYIPAAECGKPVIYLYPETDQQVTVKVGANITVSEPTYPTEGWTVLAHPDGQLDYQGQTYPNLFWEGTGWGRYPNYQNRGVVVAQKDLVSILYQHLSQLGLNQQESADFMDFWQERLPNSPYVRLTWLNTKDMDQLAPLAVSPKPDTSIRIFLEFQGLQKPVSLIPQKLSAPARRGFTLIEWGGLLIKN